MLLCSNPKSSLESLTKRPYDVPFRALKVVKSGGDWAETIECAEVKKLVGQLPQKVTDEFVKVCWQKWHQVETEV